MKSNESVVSIGFTWGGDFSVCCLGCFSFGIYFPRDEVERIVNVSVA